MLRVVVGSWVGLATKVAGGRSCNTVGVYTYFYVWCL